MGNGNIKIIDGLLIEYNKPDENGNVFLPGCFGDSIKQMGNIKLSHSIKEIKLQEISLLADGTHGIGFTMIKN